MNFCKKNDIFKEKFFFILVFGNVAVFSFLFPKQSFALKANNIIHPGVAEPAKPLVSQKNCFCSEQVFKSNCIKKENGIRYNTSVAPIQKKTTLVEQKSSLCTSYSRLNNKPASELIVHNINLKPAFPKII